MTELSAAEKAGFSRRLLEIQRAFSLSQKAIASAVRIDQPTVSRFLKGDYKRLNPSAQRLVDYVIMQEEMAGAQLELPLGIRAAVARYAMAGGDLDILNRVVDLLTEREESFVS